MIVLISSIRGQPEPEEGEVKREVKTVDVKCGKCEKDTQFPPAQQCHGCGAYVCSPCTPRADAKDFPVCDGAAKLMLWFLSLLPSMSIDLASPSFRRLVFFVA